MQPWHMHKELAALEHEFIIRFKQSGVEVRQSRYGKTRAEALKGLQEYQAHCAAHPLNPVQFEIKGVDYAVEE